MKAAVLSQQGPIANRPLAIREIDKPQLVDGEVLLKVRACGVCRTDLHIVEGDLPLQQEANRARPPDCGRCRRNAQ